MTSSSARPPLTRRQVPKPAPDIFNAALEQLDGIRAAEALVGGDTRFDLEAAGRGCFPAIAVLCGGTDEITLREAGALDIYRDPADLLASYDDLEPERWYLTSDLKRSLFSPCTRDIIIIKLSNPILPVITKGIDSMAIEPKARASSKDRAKWDRGKRPGTPGSLDTAGDATDSPRPAIGTLERTRSLLLAALRLWELKRGIRD